MKGNLESLYLDVPFCDPLFKEGILSPLCDPWEQEVLLTSQQQLSGMTNILSLGDPRMDNSPPRPESPLRQHSRPKERPHSASPMTSLTRTPSLHQQLGDVGAASPGGGGGWGGSMTPGSHSSPTRVRAEGRQQKANLSLTIQKLQMEGETLRAQLDEAHAAVEVGGPNIKTTSQFIVI